MLIPFMPIKFGARNFQGEPCIAFRTPKATVLSIADMTPTVLTNPCFLAMDGFKLIQLGLEPLASLTAHRMMSDTLLAVGVRIRGAVPLDLYVDRNGSHLLSRESPSAPWNVNSSYQP